MADMDRIAKIEVLDDGCGVSCIVVHVVTVADLAGATVATTVMRNDAIALSEEEKHLVIPVVGAERPAMVEDDRLSILRTPILVEDLGAVFRGDVFIAHGMFFL